MTWYDMIWYDNCMLWYYIIMVWYDMIWYDCNMIWYDMIMVWNDIIIILYNYAMI